MAKSTRWTKGVTGALTGTLVATVAITVVTTLVGCAGGPQITRGGGEFGATQAMYGRRDALIWSSILFTASSTSGSLR